MKSRAGIIVSYLALFLLAAAPRAGAQLKKLNLSYTATSPYQAVVIIAQQAGLFRKYGLDATLIFMAGGSHGIQAMVGGDVPITQADGSASVSASVAGVDVVMVASSEYLPYSLVSLPEIKTVEQLKGGRSASAVSQQRDGPERQDGARQSRAQCRKGRHAAADRRPDRASWRCNRKAWQPRSSRRRSR
jgi:NitT/TauT family transport system substrate-binding protein